MEATITPDAPPIDLSGRGVNAGRWTADPQRERITVFLIGMRANRWWQLGRVLRVASAMPRCLRHLATHPEAGMLGYQQWFGRTTMLVSYWRSPEHLQAFAADPQAPHLEPWRRYNKQLQGSGSVGVWHETYEVPTADLEAIYVDMPAFGLGRATELARVGAGQHTARQRLGRARGGAPHAHERDDRDASTAGGPGCPVDHG